MEAGELLWRSLKKEVKIKRQVIRFQCIDESGSDGKLYILCISCVVLHTVQVSYVRDFRFRRWTSRNKEALRYIDNTKESLHTYLMRSAAQTA